MKSKLIERLYISVGEMLALNNCLEVSNKIISILDELKERRAVNVKSNKKSLNKILKTGS